MMYLTLMPRANFELSARLLDDSDLLASARAAAYLCPRFAQGRTPTQPWALLWDTCPGTLATAGTYYAAELWHRVHGRARKGGKERAKKLYFELEGWRKQLLKPRRDLWLPDWFGKSELHESHQLYIQTRDPDDLWWPTSDEEEF